VLTSSATDNLKPIGLELSDSWNAPIGNEKHVSTNWSSLCLFAKSDESDERIVTTIHRLPNSEDLGIP